jgi:hypothetical protein
VRDAPSCRPACGLGQTEPAGGRRRWTRLAGEGGSRRTRSAKEQVTGAGTGVADPMSRLPTVAGTLTPGVRVGSNPDADPGGMQVARAKGRLRGKQPKPHSPWSCRTTTPKSPVPPPSPNGSGTAGGLAVSTGKGDVPRSIPVIERLRPMQPEPERPFAYLASQQQTYPCATGVAGRRAVMWFEPPHAVICFARQRNLASQKSGPPFTIFGDRSLARAARRLGPKGSVGARPSRRLRRGVRGDQGHRCGT